MQRLLKIMGVEDHSDTGVMSDIDRKGSQRLRPKL